MKQTFRQSMAWLHTWAGLVLGWVLYLMFVTGTAGYLDTEIDRWMKPEAPPAAANVNALEAAQVGAIWLQTQAPVARRWFIALPSDRNNPYLRTFWEDADGNTGNDNLDIATGRPFDTRETGGGQLLYQMHWRLHYLPETFTNWFISVATMFMFVAMVTGIIIHKNIFKDFFTFRPRKGQRSWMDAHNVLSVMTLPFQLMITYSGLIFMMFVCMPLVIAAYYGGGEDGQGKFFDEVFSSPAIVEAAGVPANMIDLAAPIAAGEACWGSGKVGSLEIDHPNDANARITVNGPFTASPLRSAPSLTFDGVTGELLDERAARTSAIKATRDVFLGLHEGLFADPWLRVLYLLSGLMGAAMVATGLVLWTTKRRQKLARRGRAEAREIAFVERLNVGTIVGLPIGIAAYFWANRLLPHDMAGRADWEVHAMFIAWGMMLLHAAVRPKMRVWREQWWMAAIAFGLLPLINVLTADRGLLHSLSADDWVFAGFDLSMLGLGLVSLMIAQHQGLQYSKTSYVRSSQYPTPIMDR